MRWFSTINVGSKLIGGFLIVAAIAAIIGLIAIFSASRLNSMTDTMYQRDLVGLRHVSDANISLLAAERTVRDAMLATTDEIRQLHMRTVPELLKSVRSKLNLASSSFITEEDQEIVNSALTAFTAYETGLKGVVQLIQGTALGETRRAGIMIAGAVRPLAGKTAEIMAELIQQKQHDANQLYASSGQLYQQVLIIMGALTALGVLLAIIIGTLITRGLTRQLGGQPHDVAAIASAIASGNLNTRINTSGAQKNSVIFAMNLMQTSLRNVVAAVRSSSDHIAAGSSQIAIGNTDLSQRTEEQAANITETAAAMEQLSSTVKSNAEVARQAALLSSSTSTAAVQGGEVVNQMITTMDGINQSSKKIVDIIDVIDGIAFQTNILALNAAVEAARAGEQGRGFAVVASEVRSLAQRSASAARDIKNLIDDSVNKVDTGTKMTYAAGETIQGIVKQVKNVTDLINEISAATTEQTLGLTQVNDAVIQLSNVTQQNATLVDASATAAENLNQQAQNLVDVVRIFELDGVHSSLSIAPTLQHLTSKQTQQKNTLPALSLVGYGQESSF